MRNKLNNLVRPITKFVQVESFGGILLFSAAVIALIWANSPLSDSYIALWHYEIGFEFGDFHLSHHLLHWINDGLMVIFFFVIGLEIKREILLGELNSLKKASLPIFAALGGVFIPIGIFLALNTNPETHAGWGIPMATDIAFSLAILQLLGNRVPISLKIFLTAFAIVDDLVAVLAIALFYSSNIDWNAILYSLIPLAFLAYLGWKGFYYKYVFLFLGIVIWFLFLKSGIHPTIAGILIALTIPIKQKLEMDLSMSKIESIATTLINKPKRNSPILTHDEISLIGSIQKLSGRVQSPLQHLEHKFHGWVAYFIMPIFALSNAGIVFNDIAHLDWALSSHISVALIFGKCIGVVSFSYLAVKLGIAAFPGNVSFKHILGVGFLAGVGFTMSIFVSNLAFKNSLMYQDAAKVGIFIGSTVAGLIGYFILKSIKPSDDTTPVEDVH
ncbi:Na+/H+ antiporter NhaA [Formosa algae]|uniref:Na+/H+ antiporter NhaA n=1 Tax=Formosa algae TaxID=225843 RepID=UPI000CCF2409|nr:Na+/H+ antiporter NhaA [Formosa algae]PNW28305.1 Na+/H+ antiporter NhaA [Formosa algae]